MPDINIQLLRQFSFQALFVDMGWDYPGQGEPYQVELDGQLHALAVVAHKRGVQILHALPDHAGHIPPYATRQKIERKITAQAREHLIVFTDAEHSTQIWQWVSRAPGRPNQYREVHWRVGESTELLRQKLSAITFTLGEEETLSVLGIAARLQAGFDRDKVTKKFYGEFEKQRKSFAEFIAGIPDTGEDLRWYTAVLIDRLMFLWFLQEKRFLDDKKDYLQQRLMDHVNAQHAISFYRRFLCPLFFRGFAEERTEANRATIRAEFGDVPFLNGGLFARHELEQRHCAALDVADAAFEKLFAFFAQWDWHLDDRPLEKKAGKADKRDPINPDVLGYIFEKFVNQKQMGAYYTKEDITEYIGKNTIIPSVLAKVRAEHPGAFDALAWPLLQESGDAYLYPAMLKGVDLPYPSEIAAGLDTQAPDLLTRRKPWNKRANDAASLPTEIWRETITRHQRTREIRARITAGELRDVSDLITWNLDIRQFAQDLIERCTDAALLKSFWFTLAGRLPRKSHEKFRHGLSVLDPTCGSGAFLFAALNILKPLYDATLRTLHAVRSDALIAGEKTHPEKWAEVDEILTRFATTRIDREQDYAVIKHIIVHNLYGVDIEEQATEIAKLRLFLKLVALLEPGDAIEPLPDIDFNIRHGNTLVGYASADETERAVMGKTQGNLFNDAWEDIRIRLCAVEQQYNNFQIQQVQKGGHITAQDKQALTDTLYELEETLNYHLAREYGVDPNKTKGYDTWKASHKPFHWFVDFYPLMAAGGFDVVIGNPPYKDLKSGGAEDTRGYTTIGTKNLYPLCFERSLKIGGQKSRIGLIVPVSSISTEGYKSLQALVFMRNGHLSSFDDRPSRLFDGLEHIQLTIHLLDNNVVATPQIWVTDCRRWSAAEREILFATMSYSRPPEHALPHTIPKIKSALEADIWWKVSQMKRPLVTCLSTSGRYSVNYSRKVHNFLQAIDFIPEVSGSDGILRPPSELKPLRFASREIASLVLCVLNSSLFRWYIQVFTDCRHVNKREVDNFPLVTDIAQTPDGSWLSFADSLSKSLKSNSEFRSMKFAHDHLRVQCIIPKHSKAIIDDIDGALSYHFGLTEEQLDFLVNYDIKYRIGQGDDDA
jgi:hypothetical protein